MWLFLWFIFQPTYLEGLFYSSSNPVNYSCSRFKQDSRNIFGKRLSVFALSTMRKFVTSFRHQKELHICGFYSHLKQFFRDHCLLQKPNQHSNNTADERFSPLEFSIDKYSYFCHKLVSNYCRPIFRASYSIFHIYLQLGYPKSRNQCVGNSRLALSTCLCHGRFLCFYFCFDPWKHQFTDLSFSPEQMCEANNILKRLFWV